MDDIIKVAVLKAIYSALSFIFCIIMSYIFLIPVLGMAFISTFLSDDAGKMERFLSSWFTPATVEEFSCRDTFDGSVVMARFVSIPFVGEGELYVQRTNLEWIPIYEHQSFREFYFKSGNTEYREIYSDDFLVASFDERLGRLSGVIDAEFCESTGLVLSNTYY